MCKTFRRREWVRAAVVNIFNIFLELRFLFIFQFSNSFKWLEATLIDAEGVLNESLIDFYSTGFRMDLENHFYFYSDCIRI